MTGIEPAYSAWECDLMALPQVGGLVLRGVSRVFRVLVASVEILSRPVDEGVSGDLRFA